MLKGRDGRAASWVCPGGSSLEGADCCSPPLAREDHPDLIQNAKKSDIPEKPKTPQQLWYTHEKKVYLKVRPDVSVRPRGGGRGHMAAARGGAAPGRLGTEQERRPLPRGGLHGQGRGQLACKRVRARVSEPVPLHPGGTPPLCLLLLACGGHACDLLWPEGAGPQRPPPPSPPPAPGCLRVSDGFWFAGHYEGGEGLPGEAVVSALGQKEAEMDS